ncbi:MAG TPA: phosphate signaling complex protein PhoU [Acetomicrobium flavidum]|uniref:Phosphate-specific transport system accessory protein PhoU n=2 Tax=Acetomicrobium TaxID=49894 RepID=I4BTW2_ACEMN|nr:phosphate signaling complex protein PhoU [Acetomicrobium mobile]SIN67541.1 phosphate transport system protein [Acetomicrobium flavidum]AFM20719.1 phosphate transport system regulatory protein PhoU [Acetomicrobium mobile DSM 13181]HOJ82860.1 phosphate signaling complex protein PhoU [Acetomicrobium flavidum]HOM31074.1 phosphate signaling complex protein PhoU [Acetomicrobium flavidum]HOP87556.1 phosphate signaling complex protein PhoU [Acetomicrobium flavidum]
MIFRKESERGEKVGGLFERDRKWLFERLYAMVDSVERALDGAMQAMIQKSDDLALEVIENDDVVDLIEVEVEQECLRLLAMRQPVREDLRFVFTIIKIITELERIGDQAVNIAERALELNREGLLKPLIDIPRMSEIVKEMVGGAVKAFEAKDVDRLIEVYERDDEVDALNRSIFAEMVQIMASTRLDDPYSVKKATDLLSVSRYLERAGDHATNIAERAFFSVTGERIKEKLSRATKSIKKEM